MCGAADSQRKVFNQQESAYQTLQDQAGLIFGNSSKIFQDLVASFSPVLAAGPGQSGYTLPERRNLESQAITATGESYRHAAQAAGERAAASGGGGMFLPAGSTAATQAGIAQAGAQETASQLADIRTRDAELGRQNWLTAAQVLGGAPGVFAPATSAGQVATGAGTAAGETANQIAAASNSWMSPVAGILGGISGGLVSGLMPKPKAPTPGH
jgi:hypothetical protein